MDQWMNKLCRWVCEDEAGVMRHARVCLCLCLSVCVCVCARACVCVCVCVCAGKAETDVHVEWHLSLGLMYDRGVLSVKCFLRPSTRTSTSTINTNTKPCYFG